MSINGNSLTLNELLSKEIYGNLETIDLQVIAWSAFRIRELVGNEIEKRNLSITY